MKKFLYYLGIPKNLFHNYNSLIYNLVSLLISLTQRPDQIYDYLHGHVDFQPLPSIPQVRAAGTENIFVPGKIILQ